MMYIKCLNCGFDVPIAPICANCGRVLSDD